MCKILCWNSKRFLRKLQKMLGATLFCCTRYIVTWHLLEKKWVDEYNYVIAKLHCCRICKIADECSQQCNDQLWISTWLADTCKLLWARFKLHRGLAIFWVYCSHGSVLTPVCTTVHSLFHRWCGPNDSLTYKIPINNCKTSLQWSTYPLPYELRKDEKLCE